MEQWIQYLSLTPKIFIPCLTRRAFALKWDKNDSGQAGIAAKEYFKIYYKALKFIKFFYFYILALTCKSILL